MEPRASKFVMPDALTAPLVISIVRIGCLAALAYWSLVLVAPFLTIIMWSIILTVALYPVFEWLSAKLGGHRVVAASLITCFGLLVILGPVTWLGLSLIETVRFLIAEVGNGNLAIPPPREAVKAWPLIGGQAYEIWDTASTNLKELLTAVGPQLRSLGTHALVIAGSTSFNLIKFLTAMVVSGFLFIPGRAWIASVKDSLNLIATEHGGELVDLAGATIRNVSRGVIGIAVLQALLAGIGFMVAGIRAAGLLGFLVLLFGFIQFPSLVLVPVIAWSWFTMPTTTAIIFTAYMLPLTFMDNVLRPLVMAKGLSTPMPVILVGILGGMLVHGLIGVFIGPIVLSIGWQVLMTWVRDGTKRLDAAGAAADAPETAP